MLHFILYSFSFHKFGRIWIFKRSMAGFRPCNYYNSKTIVTSHVVVGVKPSTELHRFYVHVHISVHVRVRVILWVLWRPACSDCCDRRFVFFTRKKGLFFTRTTSSWLPNRIVMLLEGKRLWRLWRANRLTSFTISRIVRGRGVVSNFLRLSGEVKFRWVAAWMKFKIAQV